MKSALRICAVMSLLLMSCGPSVVAPRSPDGSPIKVAFLLDASWEQVDQNNANQVSQRKDLASFISDNMMSRLRETGYMARVINAPAEYLTGSGEYLLMLKVIKYDAGSKAARMLVGFGAGAAVLDSHGELSRDGVVLMKKDQSIGSGMTWQKIVNKTNLLLVQEMTNFTR